MNSFNVAFTGLLNSSPFNPHHAASDVVRKVSDEFAGQIISRAPGEINVIRPHLGMKGRECASTRETNSP